MYKHEIFFGLKGMSPGFQCWNFKSAGVCLQKQKNRHSNFIKKNSVCLVVWKIWIYNSTCEYCCVFNGHKNNNCKWYKTFESTRSLLDNKRSRRPKISNETVESIKNSFIRSFNTYGFFLGYVKQKVYSEKIMNVQHLIQRIQEAIAPITPDIL